MRDLCTVAKGRNAAVYRWLVAGIVALGAACTLSSAALAATITVTSSADDLTPNDGTVSLREAITAINAGNNLGDPDIVAQGTFGVNDTINFNISASGTRQTIAVGSSGLGALPAITTPVAINGYSEQGASRNTLVNGDNAVPLIALDGINAGPNADGLLVAPSGEESTIEGLDIFDFSLNQVELQGGGDLVAGNDIGYDTTGAPTRSPTGIRISGSNSSTIGGTTPDARNLISGNVGSGVVIAGTTGNPAIDNLIQGDFIGTDPSGMSADGNGRFVLVTVPLHAYTHMGAVLVEGGNANTIGGVTAGARNVISGNGAGVDIRDGGENNLVQGNFIGVAADGVTPLPNLDFGVHVGSSDNSAPPAGPGQANEPATAGNVVGLNPNASFGGLGNVIADNGGDGVQISGNPLPNNATPIANSGNSVLGNSIYSNGGRGIDLLGGGGVGAANDPNNDLAAPTITSLIQGAASTAVQGTLSLPGRPNMTVRVEVFASPRCDANGFGEGQTLVGSTTATTNGSGTASFTANVAPVASGQVVTATATNTTADPSAQVGSINVFNTSQFSACITMPLRMTSIAISCTPGSLAVGASATCTATVSDTAPGTASTPGGSVTFSSDGSGSFSGLGSCALSVGSCSVSYTPTAVGSADHKITAIYFGDAGHAGSSASTIEVVSSGSSSGGPGGGTSGRAAVTVGHVKVAGITASVPLSCTGATAAQCNVTLTVSVAETVKGNEVIAVSAAKKKTKTRVEVLAGASVTLTAGQSRTVKLTLNALGNRLLAKRHHLAVKLTVAETGQTKSSQTVTFKTARRKHKH